jgi:hypothetical protein
MDSDCNKPIAIVRTKDVATTAHLKILSRALADGGAFIGHYSGNYLVDAVTAGKLQDVCAPMASSTREERMDLVLARLQVTRAHKEQEGDATAVWLDEAARQIKAGTAAGEHFIAAETEQITREQGNP